MSIVAIRAEGLSKCYRIGHLRASYQTLRDTWARAGRLLIGKLRGQGSAEAGEETEIWALREVSFEVRQGEIMGIIGRNGAGKSTLLKILSRITWPTAGHAAIRGRVGSLLEVGTGFHPDLTGRENVYLNGAILGMKRSEIDRRFDAIVAFAEIDRYLDTPVKRYSSGMFARLAFAVAAHMDPEVLLVDEVLAVGDTAFQKKCLGKMGDMVSDGRTVCYVSHNLSSVIQICSRVILLERGRIQMDAPPREVVGEYTKMIGEKRAELAWDPASAPGDATVKLRALRLRDAEGEITMDHFLSRPITVEMELDSLEDNLRLVPSIQVFTGGGTHLFSAALTEELAGHTFPRGCSRLRWTIPAHLLNDDHYKISAFVEIGGGPPVVRQHEVLIFRVIDDLKGPELASSSSGGGLLRPRIPVVVESASLSPRAFP